jgi:hypothetical protein
MKEIWNGIKDTAVNIASIPKDVFNQAIRDKAIKEAKIRLMEEGLTMEEAGLDKSEIIVREEEDKIKAKIKDMSAASIIAMLGLEALLG